MIAHNRLITQFPQISPFALPSQNPRISYAAVSEIKMSDEIPFHIQEQIIKRLPVVSLLRFRSVSKAWKSLIDSSNFIAAHSLSQSQHLLLRYEDPDDDTAERYVSFVDDDIFPQQRFVHTLPHSVKLLKQSNIVGSSLGLLCLHGYYEEGEDFRPNLESEMVVLWNPSIRKSITVPMPNKFNVDPETDLGFGVCPVTSDPKIVEITQFHKTSYHCEAKVYTMSSGKWGNLSSNLPSKPFRVFWPQVVVDRFIYWCAFDPMTMDNGLPNHNLIMSFDLINENFGVVDLPDSLRRHSPSQLCISKVRESLVMLEYDSFVKRACGVWMMENGVEKSFTKRFTVEATDWSRTITTLGFRKSGQPIMEVENGHEFIEQSELVVYEPNSERFNYLEIYGTTETFSVHSYMETLVLIGRSDCNIEVADEIPFHIQEQIIKKLPVVSLLQFRSVSKAWKSLIDSSDFIAAHSVTQPQHLLLRYEDPDDDTAEKYVSFVDDDTFPQQRFVHTLPHSIKLLKQSNIVGSSLGLLCFHGYYEAGEDFCPNLETEMVVLWNPSIRKSITIPMPNKFNLDPETDLGFGVCHVTSDPKIVEITQFHKTSYHCEAKVYTVSSSKWRNLSSNLPSKPFRIFWPQVVVDRFIYWCAFDPMTRDNGLPNHNLIMSFDMTNDNFGVVDLPDSLRCLSPTQLCISKVRESLVMLGYDSFVKRSCGVWMMENGVEKSFTKRFTVEAPDWSRTITTLGFRKSGQPIMEVENGHEFFQQSELVAYEPNSERFNDLEIYGTTETFSVHSYMETLVLIGQSNCNIEVEDDGHIATPSLEQNDFWSGQLRKISAD